jgi:hypothetical protein
MAVKGAVVGEIKVTLRPRFVGPNDEHGDLELVQVPLVLKGHQVSENGRSRIT